MLPLSAFPSAWRAAAEFVADASLSETLADLDQLAPPRLRQLFGADLVVWERFDRSFRHLAFSLDPLPACSIPDLHGAFLQHFPQHPGYSQFRGLFSRGGAYILSDFGATRRFVQTGLWSEVYIHLRARHQVGLGAPISESVFQTTSVNRLGRDFGSHERELAHFLFPRYAQIVRRVQRRESAAEIAHGLTAFFLREAAYALVASDGTLKDCSPAARALFDAQPSPGGAADRARLPENFRSLLAALQPPPPGAALSRQLFRSVPLPGGATALLLHIQTSLTEPVVVIFQPPGTTPRANLTRSEAEILVQISAGRSNAKIAQSLRISPRTVEKHCTSLFAKLGVESRFAAALFARSGVGPC